MQLHNFIKLYYWMSHYFLYPKSEFVYSTITYLYYLQWMIPSWWVRRSVQLWLLSLHTYCMMRKGEEKQPELCLDVLRTRVTRLDWNKNRWNWHYWQCVVSCCAFLILFFFKALNSCVKKNIQYVTKCVWHGVLATLTHRSKFAYARPERKIKRAIIRRR